ncbi:MAG: MAPEG family protein [Proteobacteria bacterium]|nr:MAPEG family protein [Pseudomonadota bacterium]
MTTELTMLAYAVALLIVLVLIQATVGVRAKGAIPMANNRDDVGPATGFHARMLRVVDNHREGITMFAPLVLIAAGANIHSSMTALGAQMFFYSRLVHAILYVTGIPLVRPLFWAAGLAGTVIILLAILGIIS